MNVEFLGNWIEIKIPIGKSLSIRKDTIINFREAEVGRKTRVRTSYGDEYYVLDMPYQEFKENII